MCNVACVRSSTRLHIGILSQVNMKRSPNKQLIDSKLACYLLFQSSIFWIKITLFKYLILLMQKWKAILLQLKKKRVLAYACFEYFLTFHDISSQLTIIWEFPPESMVLLNYFSHQLMYSNTFTHIHTHINE